MNQLTCHEAEAHLDLYVAGECDEPLSTALRQHLESCAACAEAQRQAQQVVGLLDLHFQQPQRLERLFAKLETEDRRQARPRRVLPFLRRASSLAAMVLVTVGLSVWLGTSQLPKAGGSPPLAVTLWLDPARGTKEMVKAAQAAELARGREAPAADKLANVFPLDLKGQTPQEFRQQLRTAAETNRLPPPPEVGLKVLLSNTTSQPLRVWTEGERTQVTLDLQGPGALNVVAGGRLSREEEAGEPVVLKPGESLTFSIADLTYRDRGESHRLYWTEPGDYTLTARIQTAVSPPPPGTRAVRAEGSTFGYVTLTPKPIRIRVEEK
jgi:hypothetical protein